MGKKLLQLGSYQGVSDLLRERKGISRYKLIWMKAQGCYYEFGLKETMRRIAKEILSPVRAAVNGLDISIVTEKLAIGASPTSHEAIRQLLNLGFKRIIDLRAERKQSDILSGRRDILVDWIPTYDDWKPKSFELFEELHNALNPVLKNSHTKLLICCGAGEHRAPLAGVVALIMMGYPLDTAIGMIQRARPVAELLPVYVSSLKQFLASTNRVFQPIKPI